MIGHGSEPDDSTFEVSSGNAFADIGLPDADAALAKADVALRIAGLIEERGWMRPQSCESRAAI